MCCTPAARESGPSPAALQTSQSSSLTSAVCPGDLKSSKTCPYPQGAEEQLRLVNIIIINLLTMSRGNALYERHAGLFNFILLVNLGRRFSRPHFTVEETEAKEVIVNCPWLHS